MFNPSRKQLTIVIFAAIFTIYIWLYFLINRENMLTSSFPYYSLLLNAVLHGRLDIVPWATNDLSFFQGKWYLNWGPAALFYILPFEILGMGMFDKIYTLLAGLSNIVIFYFLLKEFIKYFKIELTYFSQIFLVLCFGLSSPNLYLSLSGRIWCTEQILGVFYILISLLFIFKFLNGKKMIYFILSIIFFALAWLTRAPLVFHGFVFLGVIFSIRKDKRIKKIASMFILGCIFSLTVFFIYNYLRFQNIFENGLLYHNANPRYVELIKTGKIFSLDYISFNFYHFFLNLPSFSVVRPYVNLDLEGNSIFAFYPVLIFIPIFFIKYVKIISKNVILALFFVTIFFELSLLLIYFATGWTQVGMRYFFDLIPLTFLLSAFVIDRVRKEIKIYLIFYGAILNIIGALIFFSY